VGRGEKTQRRGAEAGEGNRYDAPPSLREAELPMRRGRRVARAGDPELLRAQPGQVGDPAWGAGRSGAGGDSTLSGGPPDARVGGQRWTGEPGQPASQTGLNDAFAASATRYQGLVGFLAGGEAASLTHAELEERIRADGFELLRLLLQDHLDLRASREERIEEVTGADGVCRGYAEADHGRSLVTLFGEVRVSRLAYRRKGVANLHPADATLNLPEEPYSHGLRAMAATEAARGSFEEAVAAIDRGTAAHVGKRQAEGLARAAAVDFEAFCERTDRQEPDEDDVVVISADGKGIVMRPDGLRPATAAKAAIAKTKLKGRLSKGEKTNRKRMAEVGAVYTVTPVPRSPIDVMAHRGDAVPKPAPEAKDKWVTASVVDDAAEVIGRVFDEAARRDPGHRCRWIALVDGNNHQIDRIDAEASARDIEVTVLVDWVHVLEYIWASAWSFFDEGDPAAEEWVEDKAIAVLEGRSSIVAAAIRRKATTLGLDDATRKNADACADYLLAKTPYLDYPTALAAGWPIATGVIEGAVRHVVKDRMDITGARWGLAGAEAVLKLRALRANGCWDDYWSYHLTREHQRVHASRYLDSRLPTAA
jgi:hypothetical protein